jgi:hypothetical protein
MELRDPVELTRGASMAWFATAARKRVCVRQQQSRRQPPLHHRRSGKRCLELPAPAHNPRIRNGAVSVALERWSRSRVRVPPNRKMATCSSDISIVEARARSRQPGARSVFPRSRPRAGTSRMAPVMGGRRTVRPITVFDLANGEERKLCDDCRRRPREWIDERWLILAGRSLRRRHRSCWTPSRRRTSARRGPLQSR